MSIDEDRGQESTAHSQLIAHARTRCHQARAQYVQSANTLDEGAHDDVAAAELHNAVIDYWFTLRPLRDEPVIKDFWKDVELWDRNGETVTGFDALEERVVQYDIVHEQQGGYLGSETVKKRIPVRMPPQVLIHISVKLDEAAVKLGFKPDTDDGRDKLYKLRNKDTEDYDEPVDESIQKPT